MFEKRRVRGCEAVLPWIRMKTLCCGDRTPVTQFRLGRGGTLPAHSGPHEQTGYLVQGHICLSISPAKHDAGPGDCRSIPAGVEHGAQILEDSAAVEIFSPVRDNYLPERP